MREEPDDQSHSETSSASKPLRQPTPDPWSRDDIDLSGQMQLTAQLLYDNTAWRTRAVEQFNISGARSVQTRRSLQIAPLRAIVESRVPEACSYSTASVVLPLTVLPKQPLVSFSLETEQGPAYFLKRVVTAEFQTNFFQRTAEQYEIAVDGPLLDIVRAICEYSPGFWLVQRQGGLKKTSRDSALIAYVRKIIEEPVSDLYVRYLDGVSRRIGAKLRGALDEAPAPDSSCDNPLLAICVLSGTAHVTSGLSVVILLRRLDRFVDECLEARAFGALVPLAEYGRRYDALVQCTVNLDQPTVLHMSQDMPLAIDLLGRATLPVIFNDAESNHVAVKMQDPDVRLYVPNVVDACGRKIRLHNFIVGRENREEYALYGSTPDRPYLMHLRLKLRISREAWWTTGGLIGLTTLATALTLAIRPLESDTLAVLVVPTTLISGFLLTQSRTAVAAKLQRPGRAIALCAILTLWTVVAILYLCGVVDQVPVDPVARR